MPMPNPHAGESKEDFIKRFMGDPIMVKEYPDAAQRRAIAEKQWERKERAYDEFAEVPRTYKWTIEGAKSWLAEHNYSSGNMRTTENFYRFRQTDPDKYSRFENLVIGESRPVMLVRGVLPNGEYETQSVVFYHGKGEAATDEFKEPVETNLKRINNIPIFRAGNWKGGRLSYPIEKLKQMVESAKELAGRVIPYLYLDHTGEKGTKEFTGLPRVGFMENFRLKGNDIIADLAGIPKKLYDLIQIGAYRARSVDIAKDWIDSITNKKHSRLIISMGFQGASHPAVNTLPAINANLDDYHDAYFGSNDNLSEYDLIAFDKFAEFVEPNEIESNITNGGGDNMDHEKEMAELREKLRTAEAKCQAAEDANVANVKESQERVDAANAEVEKVKAELANRDKSEVKRKIDDFIGEWKERGKILPAQEDLYRDKFERAEKLDEELQEWGKKLEGMPNLVELDEIASKNRIEDQPDSVKREFFKDEFTSDMKSVGNRGPEDEAEIIEFAEVFANFKPGERAEHLEKCRENLRKEVLSYIK